MSARHAGKFLYFDFRIGSITKRKPGRLPVVNFALMVYLLYLVGPNRSLQACVAKLRSIHYGYLKERYLDQNLI